MSTIFKMTAPKLVYRGWEMWNYKGHPNGWFVVRLYKPPR